MSDGGKGSAPRPFSVSSEEYDKRWETIFGKKEKRPLPQTLLDNIKEYEEDNKKGP